MKNTVAHAPIHTAHMHAHKKSLKILLHYSDREEHSCTRAHTHSTHARTQEVSEDTMTSPNHALQYCHVIIVYLIINKQVWPSAALASQRAQCFNL